MAEAWRPTTEFAAHCAKDGCESVSRSPPPGRSVVTSAGDKIPASTPKSMRAVEPGIMTALTRSPRLIWATTVDDATRAKRATVRKVRMAREGGRVEDGINEGGVLGGTERQPEELRRKKRVLGGVGGPEAQRGNTRLGWPIT